MNKASFFTLPIIGSLVYFVLSCILSLCFFFAQPDSGYFFEALWYSFSDFLLYFLQNQLIDSLWILGSLSLVLHHANIHIINKTNTVLVIVMMAIFTVVAELIQQVTIVYFNNQRPSFLNLAINPALMMCCFLLYSLLIYYLTNFFEKYFVKSNQPFAITVTNSSNIHFILFSTFICFLLIKGYMLIAGVFDLMGSDFLKAIYIGAILLGLFLSKHSFKRPFNRIQSERLIKSVCVSALMIFICDIVYFSLMFRMPMRYYINTDMLIRAGHSLLMLILLIMLIGLILNKVTNHYFLRQK